MIPFLGKRLRSKMFIKTNNKYRGDENEQFFSEKKLGVTEAICLKRWSEDSMIGPGRTWKKPILLLMYNYFVFL